MTTSPLAAVNRFAITVSVLLGVALAGAAPASAVPPPAPPLNVLVDPSDSSVHSFTIHTEEFGATAPAARQLWISVKTRTIKITSAEFLAAGYFNFSCDATDAADRSILTAPVNGYTGATDTVRLVVQAGKVTARNGVVFTVHCRFSGPDSGGDSIWHVRTNLKAGQVVALSDSVAKQTTEVDEDNWRGSNWGSNQEIWIAPGVRMRLYSPVGFWQAVGVPAETVVGIGQQPAVDVNVTDDGSIVGFTIPSTMPVGSHHWVSVLSTTVLDTGSATTPVRTKKVGWGNPLEIVRAR